MTALLWIAAVLLLAGFAVNTFGMVRARFSMGKILFISVVNGFVVTVVLLAALGV